MLSKCKKPSNSDKSEDYESSDDDKDGSEPSDVSDRSSDETDNDITWNIPEIDLPHWQPPVEEDYIKSQGDRFTGSDANLFLGSKITKMQAISLLTSWFTQHPGISKTAFDRLLSLLNSQLLPAGNTLPGSYRVMHKALQSTITPAIEYHVCVNDCVVFQDELAKLEECPQCGEPRFQKGSVPRKKFFHLPLESRLRRMFSQEHIAKLFQEHLKPVSEASNSTTFSSIHDTYTWKDWYSADGIHSGDKRAVSFGMCTDGVNPFSKEKVNYSMWPIILFPLNFPPNIRRLFSSMMLVGIIPGPKEMSSIDPYMKIVVEDVKALNEVEMYDAYKKCTFKLKATILLHVLDYPGQNKVFHCQGTDVCNILLAYSCMHVYIHASLTYNT